MAEVVELKKDEAHEFSIGDVVKLNSGGAKMTVRKLSRSKGATMVSVDYMDAAEAVVSLDFDARQLRLKVGRDG